MKGISAIEADLRNAKLRATRQRTSLLGLLRGATSPLSVETLAAQGKGAFDTATAYRMLEAFIDAGLVRRMAVPGNRAHYETVGAHHHHATCTSCRKIVDVEACLPRTLDERVRSAAGFARIDDHALEFFGLCQSCAKKR